MATAAAPVPADYSADQPFFVRMATVLALFIVFGFAQNAALGRVDPLAAPVWVHLHGIAMLGWLGLFVAQNRLAASGNLALHRTLGRVAALLVIAILILGSVAATGAVRLGRVPPFFEPAFFLALSHVGVIAFASLVIAGLVLRRSTQAHRRLMLGATLVVMEPALGRLLPMPILGGETGEWVILGIQLAVIAVLARHDRRTLGAVHPATVVLAIGMIVAHATISLLAHTAWLQGIAAGLAAA